MGEDCVFFGIYNFGVDVSVEFFNSEQSTATAAKIITGRLTPGINPPRNVQPENWSFR